MVTFITILQVNLVMSILLYVMFLAYLYGISASTMNKQRPTQDPINTLIIKLLQADMSRRQKQDDSPPAPTLSSPAATDFKEKGSSGESQPVMDISDEILRQHKHYSSPRVLLSERPPLHPPPLYLMDDFAGSQDANRTRQKRHADHRSYRAELSVCEQEEYWVTNKTTAIDIYGFQVIVLNTFKKENAELKQYFYETKCKHMHSKGGCRGIDEKHWNSQCKTTQSFVRAYTKFKSFVSWRWIRIDTACACALSRKRRT